MTKIGDGNTGRSMSIEGPGIPGQRSGSPPTSGKAGEKRGRALSPEGVLVGLPEAKRPRRGGDSRGIRASSLPGRMPDQAPPSLSSLIGDEKVAELDHKFGSLQPVRTKGGDGIHAWEREPDGTPRTHARRLALPDAKGAFPDMNSEQMRDAVDLNALKTGEKRYIWAASALGRVFIGEEMPAGSDPVSGKPRYDGHPLLVAGGPARICGELNYDARSHALVLLDKSGRYSRYADRNATQLANVADIVKQAFADSGLSVVTTHVTGKAPEPLVLPSLAGRMMR